MARPAERGFSFLEVLMAMSVLLLGSVAVLSLFAVGVNELVQRRIDAKAEIVRPEILMRVQEAVDATPPGRAVENLPKAADGAPVPLSQPGYAFRAKFDPSPFGGSGSLAKVVLYYQGQPIRLIPPIAVVRSTIDPGAPPR